MVAQNCNKLQCKQIYQLALLEWYNINRVDKHQLGLQYYTLADWRKARKYAKKHTVVLTENEANAKICELERENAELRQANEILKDALGFFAKDRKR